MNSNHSNPVISVVLPTYNRQRLLNRAIKSVLAQSLEDIECIVVDDASTDETKQMVLSLANEDSRIRYFRHPTNQHVSRARNTGIDASFGKYISFLDDDDEFLPNKLEKQIQLLEKEKNLGLVYCWFDVMRGAKKIGQRHSRLQGNIFDKLLVSQPLGNASTIVVPKKVAKNFKFDEELRRGNDGDFIRRVARHYPVGVVEEVLVHYHVDHGGSPRITGSNVEDIELAIVGNLTKLRKFRSFLDTSPKIEAMIHLNIAKLYRKIGREKEASEYFTLAKRLHPFGLLPRIRYRVAGVKDNFKKYVP
ncbi:glycosyltransferase family 2 protein [Rhodovulum sp. YNF3179]|uniref:glycosyltransferase family 2 protein n=1 Tax=Rhodovulum sp. YNF3179 TaxID=3425127 RepID=UPI003D3469DA